MRFSLFPKAQNEIIRQASPMTAKMISKRYSPYSRQDWELIKLRVMRWVMEIKLSQHWNKLAPILKETDDKAIVDQALLSKLAQAILFPLAFFVF